MLKLRLLLKAAPRYPCSSLLLKAPYLELHGAASQAKRGRILVGKKLGTFFFKYLAPILVNLDLYIL